jgi:hypothetical protein
LKQMHNNINPCQYYVGLTIFCGIFLTFNMSVGNILKNIVIPIEYCYGYE